MISGVLPSNNVILPGRQIQSPFSVSRTLFSVPGNVTNCVCGGRMSYIMISVKQRLQKYLMKSVCLYYKQTNQSTSRLLSVLLECNLLLVSVDGSATTNTSVEEPGRLKESIFSGNNYFSFINFPSQK